MEGSEGVPQRRKQGTSNAMSDSSEIDPPHGVLPRAFDYAIVGLRLELEPGEADETFLDLTLRRASERVVLRFWSPQELEIERGGPRFTGGLEILDIRGRGWEGLGVEVGDFEASNGKVRFWARAVERLHGNGGQ